MLESLKRKRFLTGLIVAITIGIAFCLAFNFDLLYTMQLQSSDFLFRGANLNQSKELDNKIVVVGIDDKSLEQLGRFSLWPRSYHAHLIDILAEAKARVVAFDILFSEPAPGDEQLATSIAKAGNIVLPVVHKPTQSNSPATGETMGFGSFLRPLEVFEESAIALGHANLLPDKDGVVRRLPIVISNGEDYMPALALATVAKYLRRPEVIESPIEDNVLPFAGRLIPISRNNSMLINYTGSLEEDGATANFQTVPFLDTLRGEIEPAFFQDKIVIIGATATGLGDNYWTPLGRRMSGVEIHAGTIHTILAGNFLKPVPSTVTVALILLLALLCGLAVLRLRVLWATLSAVFLCIIYLLAGFSFFDKGIMFNMLYPPLTILGTFVGLNLYNVTSERSERREITKAFGRYIPAPVMGKIMAALDKGELKLGANSAKLL